MQTKVLARPFSCIRIACTHTGTQIWNGSQRQRVKEGSKAGGDKSNPDLWDGERKERKIGGYSFQVSLLEHRKAVR